MADEADQGDPSLQLKRVRLSFADNIADAEKGEPRVNGKHKGKVPYRWSANFIIAGSDEETIKAVRAAMRIARDRKWPDPDTRPKIKPEKQCLRDGSEESYAGYPGNWYVSASQTAYGRGDEAPKRPFRIIDRNKVKLDDGTRGFPDAAGKIYAGCYVNVKIRIWAQDDPEYGKRLNASIEAVQFWEDGEAFGGGRKTNVDEEFDEFGGDDAFDSDEPKAKKAAPDDDLDDI